jgi:uncharacterized protein (DUF4415 family)
MSVKKRDTPAAWADPDDAPELTDDFFERADYYEGEKLVRRGRPAGSAKTSTTLRLDDDVIEYFRSTGRGWQTRINDALKEWVSQHPAGK